MAWARHVAHVGRREVTGVFWWGYLRERANWKDLRVYGEKILKFILKKFIGKIWTRCVLVQIWEKLQNFIQTNEIWIP
jgi:hypothetical protein